MILDVRSIWRFRLKMRGKKVWSSDENHLCFFRGAQKKGNLMSQVLIHIILVAAILALLITAVSGNANARGVRQQVVEKQMALLIDSAVPGMEFEISKKNVGGFIYSVELKKGHIFVGVDDYNSLTGYPYFSRYSVSVREEESKFVVSVR